MFFLFYFDILKIFFFFLFVHLDILVFWEKEHWSREVGEERRIGRGKNVIRTYINNYNAYTHKLGHVWCAPIISEQRGGDRQISWAHCPSSLAKLVSFRPGRDPDSKGMSDVPDNSTGGCLGLWPVRSHTNTYVSTCVPNTHRRLITHKHTFFLNDLHHSQLLMEVMFVLISFILTIFWQYSVKLVAQITCELLVSPPPMEEGGWDFVSLGQSLVSKVLVLQACEPEFYPLRTMSKGWIQWHTLVTLALSGQKQIPETSLPNLLSDF